MTLSLAGLLYLFRLADAKPARSPPVGHLMHMFVCYANNHKTPVREHIGGQ